MKNLHLLIMRIILLLFILLLTGCGKNDKTVYVDNAHDDDTGELALSWDKNRFPITIVVPGEFQNEPTVTDALEGAATSWNNALQDAVGDDVFNITYQNSFDNLDYPKPADYLNDNIASFTRKVNSWFCEINNVVCSGVANTNSNNNAYKNILAITAYAYNKTGTGQGQLQKADFIFNYYNFGTKFADVESSPGSTKIDLESVLVHEMGHFLGLKHVKSNIDSQSIMLESLSSNVVKRILSTGDKCRINENYSSLFTCDEETLRTKFCYDTANEASIGVKDGRCQILTCDAGFNVNSNGSKCIAE